MFIWNVVGKFCELLEVGNVVFWLDLGPRTMARASGYHVISVAFMQQSTGGIVNIWPYDAK